MYMFKESFAVRLHTTYSQQRALSELHIDEASVQNLSACALRCPAV